MIRKAFVINTMHSFDLTTIKTSNGVNMQKAIKSKFPNIYLNFENVNFSGGYPIWHHAAVRFINVNQTTKERENYSLFFTE